jgi:ankyrin repeat protein
MYSTSDLVQSIVKHNELRFLLNIHAGVNINEPGQMQHICMTPLEASIEFHNDFAFYKLIEMGADIHSTVSGNPALMVAATSDDNLHYVEVLINKGADVNYSDYDGFTPLMEATICNCPKIIKRLIDAGADPNTHNRYMKSPLNYAIKYGHMESLRTLVACGADIEYTPTLEKHPLYYSVEKNNAEALRYLIECGGNMNFLKEWDFEKNIMDIAISYYNLECVQVLLDYGIKPTIMNNITVKVIEDARNLSR